MYNDLSMSNFDKVLHHAVYLQLKVKAAALALELIPWGADSRDTVTGDRCLSHKAGGRLPLLSCKARGMDARGYLPSQPQSITVLDQYQWRLSSINYH